MLVFKREISSGTVTTIELFDKKLEGVDLRHANAHSQSKSHADRALNSKVENVEMFQ